MRCWVGCTRASHCTSALPIMRDDTASLEHGPERRELFLAPGGDTARALWVEATFNPVHLTAKRPTKLSNKRSKQVGAVVELHCFLFIYA
jgi:hypothetical protein